MLYGINPVEAALRAGKRKPIRLHLRSSASGGRLGPLRKLAGEAGIPVLPLDAQGLENLTGTDRHQGIALECTALQPGTEQEALARATAEGALTVALDQVEDPQNLGAVVRNCAAFGVAAIVQPRNHSAPLSAAASRASAGVLESAPMYAVGNLARFLQLARDRGAWTAGAAADGDTPIHRFEPTRPLILVLGNEGRGLRPLVRQGCDHLLSISAAGAESLNVASATAVLLYEITRPR